MRHFGRGIWLRIFLHLHKKCILVDGIWGISNQGAFRTFLKLLPSKKLRHSAAAAKAIGEIGDDCAVSALSRSLGRRNDVDTAIVTALGEIGGQKAYQALVTAEKKYEENREIKEAIIRAKHWIELVEAARQAKETVADLDSAFQFFQRLILDPEFIRRADTISRHADPYGLFYFMVGEAYKKLGLRNEALQCFHNAAHNFSKMSDGIPGGVTQPRWKWMAEQAVARVSPNEK